MRQRSPGAATLTGIRRFLLLLFLLGVIGTGVELILLGHTEGPWQWAPIALMTFSLATLISHLAVSGPASLRVFQGTMALFVLSGAVGLWLHYHGNAEFELELYPARRGFELFRESLTGATPTLAPGAMLELGLLGLAYTYRHPRFGGTEPAEGADS
jgi:hypothetical protein